MEEYLKNSLKETSDYKYALDQSSIIAITDQKGVINYVNENFCKISKYSAEELIGQDHRIINSGYHPKEFIRDLWGTIARGKTWRGELKNKAKDGTHYWVDTTIVPFLDEQGKPYQYVAIRADITDRKQVEEYLKKSLKETSDYKYALDHSSIIAITDQKGVINYVNDNFCKISKYSAKELIGQDHRIINSGHHPKEFIRDLWRTIAQGKIWRGELKNKAKDGTHYWVDTTIVPFVNQEGKPYQYVAIRSDITLQVENKIKLKEAKENLEAITNKLTNQNIRLANFAHITSHNLRSPVSNLNSLLHIYKELDSDEEREVVFEKFEIVINHLSATLNELIEALKIQDGSNTEKELVSFGKIFKKITEMISEQITESKTQLFVDFSKAPVIEYNPGYLESILQNLLTNAIKYRSPERTPVVHIETQNIDGQIVLTVKDNGLGIDMEKHGHKLFGLHKTFHRHAEAKGIGLFITKTQIEAMNGTISAISEVNKGTTFTVNFNTKVNE